MALEIRQFSPEWLSAVREFNRRIEAAGFGLPEDPDSEMLPGSTMYLAAEGCEVRGGYILRPQRIFFRGKLHPAAHYRLPLSEGVIDKRYVGVGPMLLRGALKAEPYLYALGMGGTDRPLPRMLQAMGWSLSSVPFYFRVVHPGRFLRHMQALRKTRWRGAVLDAAASTGLGWLGIRAWQSLHAKGALARVSFDEVEDFADWADEIWEKSHASYGMIAARDRETLRSLYPAGNRRFLRLRVKSAGWAVVLDTQMQADQYFGDLRLGTIVDCLARPEDAPLVLGAARSYLEDRGDDLIISNQSHGAWVSALETAGFLKGPSNYVFAASKELAVLAGAPTEGHITRGDGDGPVHL